MGQSLVKNYIHIVFSTKNREALIHQKIESELHAYLGGVCNKLECQVLAVGGHVDHIHILCMLSKKIALVHLIQQIKQSSSKWIKQESPNLKNFYWQDGYGAFSVNPTETKVVMNYINNQRNHHKKKSFKVEFSAFLEKYNVEYDDRYVWE